MRLDWRRSAAVLGTGLALLVAGCGGDDQPAATQGAQGTPAGPGAMFSGANLTKLADELGVAKTKLQAALKSAMPDRGQRPPDGGNGQPPADGQAPPQGTPPAGQRPPGGRGGPGDIAATLATKLDLPEAKVRKALEKVMPAGGRRQAPPSDSATPS
jgi:hypothetical protein